MIEEPGASVGSHALSRPLATTGLTWLAMLGVDLFLHAGLLAPLYDWGSPFLLEPETAFVRIPAGYLAFLIVAAGLVWLLPRLGVASGRDGAVMAGVLGAVTWAALLLGVWSISTADPALLVGWWLGQSVEIAFGGAIVGSVLGGMRLRSIAWRVLALVIALAVSAVVLQATGYAVAPVLVR